MLARFSALIAGTTAAMLAVALPVQADEAASSDAATPDAAAEAPPAEKKVCRYAQATGSLFRKKVCHTSSEWTAIEQQTSDAARRSMDKMRGNAGSLPNRD